MYETFQNSISSKLWEKIGIKRRAGVATPLFSVYSKRSVGVGDLFDLKLLIDWAKLTGQSIVQLLPMNDVGFHFVPYNAQSTFALEPMYLALDRLTGIPAKSYQFEIKKLREHFPCRPGKVNYAVKHSKLELLWSIFKTNFKKVPDQFRAYLRANEYWLNDYALFKTVKEIYGDKTWEDWPNELRTRQAGALKIFEKDHHEVIDFHKWLQWQLFEQFKKIKKYARRKKAILMGDLPFLVARDSADVWSHPNYFKLDFSSGAPPDAYFAKGQRWGTPPYNWPSIAGDGHRYLTERLQYAQEFYDVFRIDHSVGFFRIWSIPVSEPVENGGLNGAFDPPGEAEWEPQGRKILFLITQNTNMLPCAEDLGTVPESSFRVLKEFAVPGTDIQRWSKDPGDNYYHFKAPERYRPNSCATISTHDMTAFNAWWEYEAGTVYGPLFERACQQRHVDFERIKPELFDSAKSFYERLRWRETVTETDLIRILGKPREEILDLIDFYRFSFNEKAHFWTFLGFLGTCQEKSSPKLIRAAIEKISESHSIFSIQLLQDWLALGGFFKEDPWNCRINFPGTVGVHNWALVMPVSLEAMQKLPINRQIRQINKTTARLA